MPRKRIAKNNVKRVKLPDGDEGKDLPANVKREKLAVFVEQFDFEVEDRSKSLFTEMEKVCSSIVNFGKTLILQLPSDKANMTVAELRARGGSIRKPLESSLGAEMVNNLFQEVDLITKQNPLRSTKARTNQEVAASASKPSHKDAAFATPAVLGKTQPLWTATPKETPLFDKRLCSAVVGKENGRRRAAGNTVKTFSLSINTENQLLDVNGQKLDVEGLKRLDAQAKAHMQDMFEQIMQHMK